jgi:hypothetical protein
VAKICPKCGYGSPSPKWGYGLVGKTCPYCGTELEKISYLELVKKKPVWIVPLLLWIIFLISLGAALVGS